MPGDGFWSFSKSVLMFVIPGCPMAVTPVGQRLSHSIHEQTPQALAHKERVTGVECVPLGKSELRKPLLMDLGP